jgi:hypothetical protein
MQQSRNCLLVVAVFILVSGCAGGSPTSPSSGQSSAASLPASPESIEIISANAPTGATIRLVDCSDNWDSYSCFKDLQLTFSVRTNQNADLATLYTEFLTSDGKVCGNSWAETGQPLFARVVATFRTTVVNLTPDCFDLLPLKITRALTRVRDTPNPRVNTGLPHVFVELMKQEFSIDYTFAREKPSP